MEDQKRHPTGEKDFTVTKAIRDLQQARERAKKLLAEIETPQLSRSEDSRFSMDDENHWFYRR